MVIWKMRFIKWAGKIKQALFSSPLKGAAWTGDKEKQRNEKSTNLE